MNITLTSRNTSTSFNQSPIYPSRAYHDKVDYNVSSVYNFIFAGIAAVSFVGNFLLFVTICQRRSLLSKTYNILVLSLAVTDMLSGWFRLSLRLFSLISLDTELDHLLTCGQQMQCRIEHKPSSSLSLLSR